jgi:hypothetical protein
VSRVKGRLVESKVSREVEEGMIVVEGGAFISSV